MNCENCMQSYDTSIRIPKLLPNCGHSICSQCLSSIKIKNEEFFKCCQDGISYKKDQIYNDNLFILNQLQEQKNNQSSCRVHKKQLNIFCFDCKFKICVNCVLFGQHKMHNYNEIGVINQQNDKIENEIEKKFSDMNKKYFQQDFDFHQQIESLKEYQKERVKRLFNLLKNSIKFLENKYLEKLESSDVECKQEINQNIKKYQEIQNCFDQIKRNDNLDFMEKDFKQKKIYKELDCINFDQTLKQFADKIKKNLHVEIKSNLKQELQKFCLSLNIKDGNLQEPLISEEEIDLIKQTLTDLPINTSLNELKLEDTQQNNILQDANQDRISDFSFSDLQQNLNSQSNYSILSRNSYVSKNSNISKKSNMSKNSIFITNKKHYQNQSGFQDITNQIKIHQSQKRMTVRNPSKLHDKENNNLNIHNNLDKKQLLEAVEKLVLKVQQKKKICLDLSKYGLNDELMKDISKKLKNLDKIRTIKLNHNRLTEVGIKYLLKSLKSLNVEFLFMTHNQLDETCIDYLISFKKYNKKLKAVYITNNPLSKKGQQLKSKIQLLESKNVALVY